ncbi:hypothetical protein JYU34_009395 [Plutella xylostella]|uniref:Uncharacterized protein n=1 Tax=Plutella xylostella TaxID=51655 RepID=A0ABQ7QMS3_PLUXY|nr:hypothetical protein JYU34_009395 [Plutella xylostella]
MLLTSCNNTLPSNSAATYSLATRLVTAPGYRLVPPPPPPSRRNQASAPAAAQTWVEPRASAVGSTGRV